LKLLDLDRAAGRRAVLRPAALLVPFLAVVASLLRPDAEPPRVREDDAAERLRVDPDVRGAMLRG
jgi:hypothetical protein